MSKAEEFAKEYAEKFILTVDHQSDVEEAYIDGYQQAEKDLELTWDEISVLNCLLNEVEHEFKKGVHEDKSYIGYCKEVLKRFKDFKERKEK